MIFLLLLAVVMGLDMPFGKESKNCWDLDDKDVSSFAVVSVPVPR